MVGCLQHGRSKVQKKNGWSLHWTWNTFRTLFPAFYLTYLLFADPVWLIERLSLYASSSFWWSLSLQHLALLWLWQKDFKESEAGVTSSADNWFPVKLQIWWDGNPLSQGERLRIQLGTILRYPRNQSSEDFHSLCRFSAPTKNQEKAFYVLYLK